MDKNLIKPVVVLTVICLIVAALVTGVSLITRDKLTQQEQKGSDTAKSSVLREAVRFEQIKDIEDEAYIGYDGNGSVVGCVIATSGNGYGGEMRFITGFNLKGEITGVEILSEDETPGLGKNAYEEGFIGQYVGKNAEKLQVIKNGTPADDEILAISGATITSRAVTDAVNEARSIYNKVGGAD